MRHAGDEAKPACVGLAMHQSNALLLIAVVVGFGCGGPPSADDGGTSSDAGASGASCREIIACAEPCSDTSCVDACIASGSPTAIARVTALATCSENAGCGEDEACIQANCGAEVEACELTPSPVDAGPVDAGPLPATCPVSSGPGTTHSQFLDSADEVWTAAGNPHIITFPVRVRTGERLTLDPCVVVRIAHDHYLEISDGAELVAEGTASQPITFMRHDDRPWRYLYVSGYGEARLAYVTLEGGGAETATLYVAIDPNDNVASQTTHVDHVTVRDSAQLGVALHGNAGFTADSHDLTITGSAGEPLRVWQRAVGTIPPGRYTGNAVDEMLLELGNYGAYAIRGDVTIHDRGLPYRLPEGLRVGAYPDFAGTLNIEPGVTLRFESGMLTLNGNNTETDYVALGSLRAVGTVERPIVFTSAQATPAAGDWGGVIFFGQPRPDSRIEHAIISYAGGWTGTAANSCGDNTSAGDNAGLIIFGGNSQPMAPFVFHTRFEHSARYGVTQGWRGDPLDFMSTNTFVDIASCWVTYPRPLAGSCPAVPHCP